jgi:hypothetical protein
LPTHDGADGQHFPAGLIGQLFFMWRGSSTLDETNMQILASVWSKLPEASLIGPGQQLKCWWRELSTLLWISFVRSSVRPHCKACGRRCPRNAAVCSQSAQVFGDPPFKSAVKLSSSHDAGIFVVIYFGVFRWSTALGDGK